MRHEPSDRNERSLHANVSVSHISLMARPSFGAPRFHLDENATGGGGAAPAVPAVPAGASPAAPGGVVDGTNNSPSPHRPEGLPEHLFGKDDPDTIDKLFKVVDGYRRGDSDRGALPSSPTDYKLDFGDKVRPYTKNFDKDPVFKNALTYAHAAGITDKQLQKFLPGVLESFVDGGLVDAPVDPKAMLRGLAPASAASLDDAAKESAGAKRVNENVAWVDGATTQGAFGSPNSAEARAIGDFFAAALASDPRAHQAIEWLRGKDREPQPAMAGNGGGTGGVTAESLRGRDADPRNNPNSPQFDRGFAAETDKQYKQLYG